MDGLDWAIRAAITVAITAMIGCGAAIMLVASESPWVALLLIPYGWVAVSTAAKARQDWPRRGHA